MGRTDVAVPTAGSAYQSPTTDRHTQVSFTHTHTPMMVALLNSHRGAEAGSQKGSGKPEITQPGTNRTRMHPAAYEPPPWASEGAQVIQSGFRVLGNEKPGTLAIVGWGGDITRMGGTGWDGMGMGT